jgi:hypothetical protein
MVPEPASNEITDMWMCVIVGSTNVSSQPRRFVSLCSISS